MDFELCFKVHNLVSVYPKGIKLGQMTNLNVIFHVMVSVYRLVTIETRPSSLLNFGMAYTKGFFAQVKTMWKRVDLSLATHATKMLESAFF